LENLNQLFDQDILKLKVGEKIKVSFVNILNGHAHKFAVEMSPSDRLIIRIDDNETMTDSIKKEHIVGVLHYFPNLPENKQWIAKINSKFKSEKSQSIILKNIITGTANSSSWVNSKNLTREQIQNLPKRSTKRTQ
jgi:hypothetical protein